MSDDLTSELLIAKHQTYAVAWGILPVPRGYTGEPQRERVKLLGYAKTYLATRGYVLRLTDYYMGGPPIYDLMYGHRVERTGTLEQCCLRMVEIDLAGQGIERPATRETA